MTALGSSAEAVRRAHGGPERVQLAPGLWACWTDRAHGDFAPGGPDGPAVVEQRRQAVAPHPWTWLRQVHGSTAVVVEQPGARAGTVADAAVTACPGAVLSVVTADCAAVALWSDGAAGVAHAGWRGLTGGVLEAAVSAIRAVGPGFVHGRIGPAIGPCCYEFGAADLEQVAARFGAGVRGETRSGRPALDLPAAVAAALGAAGVAVDPTRPPCTACGSDTGRDGGHDGTGPGWYSHRARRDLGRQALAVWRDPT